MGKTIKTFSDGSFLEYDSGNFDGWCVYLNRPGRERIAPTDKDCFRALVDFSELYGADRLYADYVKVYEQTGAEVDSAVLEQIDQLAAGYQKRKNDPKNGAIVFTILYLAMIAEERKKNTKLGRRIKRLGVHKLLVEGDTVEHAADFMRGMDWEGIDALCTGYSF